MKADQLTVNEMKSRIRLAEERAAMQIEDFYSMMARELHRFRNADAENKQFKADLMRQKDQWAKGLEEKQR
jgi:hypothetical protein